MTQEEFNNLKEKIESNIREEVLKKKKIFSLKLILNLEVKLSSQKIAELESWLDESIFIKDYKITKNSSSIHELAIKLIEPTEISYIVLSNYIKIRPKFSETLLLTSYVFDENQTVKWNKDKVLEYNTNIKKRKTDDMAFNIILKEELKKCLYANLKMNNKLRNISDDIIDNLLKDAGINITLENILDVNITTVECIVKAASNFHKALMKNNI